MEEWPTTPEGEERQAREIEEMYRILFEHPLVEAITTWDYRDGAWLKAPSGYIRLDNSLKPSYKMLKNLVKNEWWTDTVVSTDALGYTKVEAFKGEYILSCDNMEDYYMDVSFISVNAQNSIRIDANGTIIYVDPFQIEEENHDADFIFLTHDHYDHYSLDDINKVLQRETAFIVPQAMDKKVRKNTAVGINHPVEPGKSYEVNGITFETVAMYNKMKPFHLKKAGWCGYIIDVSGTRIYIAGDIDDIDEAKAVKCDIAMIPIGGFYTMNYKEGAELINIMKPTVAIPTHYGTAVGKTTDGESFAKLVDKDIQVEIKLKF